MGLSVNSGTTLNKEKTFSTLKMYECLFWF